MDKDNDRELIKRCIDGNAEAWSKFVNRFSGLIYWAIKRKMTKYGRDYLISEVEEIHQRLFVSVWEKKSLITVSERDNIAPWLIVLASNAAIDFIRKKSLEENFLRTAFKSEVIPQTNQRKAFFQEGDSLIGEAIKFLNEKEKAYLESSFIAGKKHKEIAETFNTSINSVSTIIARAKNKIKKYIESKK